MWAAQAGRRLGRADTRPLQDRVISTHVTDFRDLAHILLPR
jgi:hypothetical protein